MAKNSCDVVCYDQDKVERVRELIARENIKKTSLIFKVLADTNRLQAAYALAKEEELCVCDVSRIIGSSIAVASHHLRALNEQGLARYRKAGKRAFYRLDDQHVKELIEIAFEHQQEKQND